MIYTLSWTKIIRGKHYTEVGGDSIPGGFDSLEEAKAVVDQFFLEENGKGNRDTIGMYWSVLDDRGVVYETAVVGEVAK